MKINKYYQYFVLVISLFCLVVGVIEKNGLLAGIGGVLLIGAIGTIMHLRSGKYNSSSKLPKDCKVDG